MAETTITDKKSFSCAVIDKNNFERLPQIEKVIFEQLRNSMLEIFPVDNGNTYSNATIKYAENFAFINTKAIVSAIDSKLEAFKASLTVDIQAMIAASMPAPGVPTV